MKSKTALYVFTVLVFMLGFSVSQVSSQSEGLDPKIGPAINVESPLDSATLVVPGGPGFVMIPAASFQPIEQGTLYNNNLWLLTLSGSPNSHYTAPVFLPQGATVTKLVYYFTDTDTTEVSEVGLWRMPVPEIAQFRMVLASSPTSPAVINSFVEATPTDNSAIDNQANAYFLGLYLPAGPTPGSILASAVRIDYTYPVSLPVVVR